MPIFLINNPKCLFAHIPKTGGNSIRNVAFAKDYEGPWFGEHLPEEWADLFGFAFVRNPFDRLVSAWKMFCEGTVDDAWSLPEGKALELTLEQVLHIGLDESAEFGHPRYNGIQPDSLIRLKNHIIPQSHPYHGLQHVQFVGRFESLQEDFDKLTRRLNVPDLKLKKTNWTNHEHYSKYFTPKTRKLAEQLYRKDLAEYGYEFQPE